jgi:rhodanese-related sulfurtransferase
VLIDIRNKFAFGQGHIPGAYSIPAYDLTHEKNIEQLKDWRAHGTTVVLYGNDQLQANGPWMFFKQIGFNNVKYLLGGYDYYKAHKDNLAETKTDNSYMMGVPRCDYATVAKSSVKSAISKSTMKKPVVVRRKKKAAVAAGGC